MKCLALESKRPSVRDLRWDPFLVSSTICLSSSSTSFAHHSFDNAESSDGAQNSSSSSSSGRGAVTLLLVCSATLSFEHISINALFFLSSHYESTHLLLIVCVWCGTFGVLRWGFAVQFGCMNECVHFNCFTFSWCPYEWIIVDFTIVKSLKKAQH